MYDEKAKEVRNSAANKSTIHSIRHYGEKVIIKVWHITSFPVKELIRELDTEEEESDYIMNKFKEKAKLVDKMAKVNTKKYN